MSVQLVFGSPKAFGVPVIKRNKVACLAMTDVSKYSVQNLTDVAGEGSVGALLKYVQPVSPTKAMIEVLERFVSESSLHAVPIVQDGAAVGLVNRSTIIELFSKPFMRELYGRKPISQIQRYDPIIVDCKENIDDLARIIIDAGMQYMYDGFIITENNKYVGMGTGHDLLNEITERKQAHLYYLAHYDQLTGLPNRLLFMDRLVHACAHALREERMIALLFMDLDRFKFINDTYGHTVGDQLLKTVSQKLSDCMRENDTIARLGGDEFIILLENVSHVDVAGLVARKVLDIFSGPITINGHELFVTASIGIALYPLDDDSEGLIKKADAAMYHAKERGRNNYQFYSPEMSVSVFERISIENSLRHALDKNELLLHYQPLVDLRSRRIVGVEALLRWQHPVMGMVSPAVFIPIAEEVGLIPAIGEQVLRWACAQNKAWQRAGLAPISMAVNLSACQMRPSLPALIESILQDTGLDARYLELELTENTLLDNVEESIAILRELSELGVKASIDDFGTGYSSLSYLQRLPIDTLKIDRSFLSDVQSADDDTTVITTIIAMARNMKLKVIAEGVETPFQMDLLCSHRCDLVQGYLFSRPRPGDEIEKVLKAGGAILSRPEAVPEGEPVSDR